MFLRYFAIMQICLTLFVSRNFVAAAVSVNDDEVCVPPEIAELAKYLKEFDYAEASISNATSPFPYMGSEDLNPSSGKEVEIETVPFGLLSVDWRRLRLLHDCLTPSDKELKAKLITVYKILSFANERLYPKFIKPTEYITSTEKSIVNSFSSTIKKNTNNDTTQNINPISTTERSEWKSDNSTSGVNDRRGTDKPEENSKTVSFTTTDDGQLVHRLKHRTTYDEENGYPDFLASTVELKLSPEVKGARETTLSGEITTPGDSSSSLTNFGRENKEDFHSTTFYDQGNSFLEREYAVNSTNNHNNHNGDDNDDDDDDNDGGISISTLKNLSIIDPELIKTVETNNLENSSTASSKVVSELGEEYREFEEVGSGDEMKGKFVDQLKNIVIDINEDKKIFLTTKSSFLETSEEFKTVSNFRLELESEDEVRVIDQDSSPYDGTTIESRLLNSGSEEYVMKKSSGVNLDEEKSVTKILKFSLGEIFRGSANVGSTQSYDSVTLETVTENEADFNPVKLTSEEIKPDESNEKIGTTFPSIESVSDKSLLKSKEESIYSKHTNTDEKVSPSIFEVGNHFKGSERTSVSKEGAVESSTDFYIHEGVVSTDLNHENFIEEFSVTSFDQKNTETNNRTIETSINTVENNRWYFTTFLPAVTEATDQISPLNEYTRDMDSDPLSEITKPTELVVLIGDEKPEPAEGIQVSRGSLQDHIGNTYYFRNDPIDLTAVKKLPSYHHYEMDNSVDGSTELRGSKSSENDPRITGGRRGQDEVTSEELTPPVFAPFHPLLAGKKPTRKHKLATTWGKGFSKRGDRNTDLEKLFRWFYKLGENSIEKTGQSWDDGGIRSIAKAEINCKTK